MSTPVVTLEQMRARVARWKDLKPSKRPLLDAVLPQYERDNFNIIGRGVTEDGSMDVAIDDARDFHLTMVRADPGKGSGLHSHKTIEAFVPLTGNWSVQWGDQGENQLMLGPWDVISIPTGIMRGFRNESPVEAFMLAIIGNTHPGSVDWNETILDQVRAAGFGLEPDGKIGRLGTQGG